MKELTVAQGMLRCGECNTAFDAMETLSSTLKESNSFNHIKMNNAEHTSENKTTPYTTIEKTAQKYMVIAAIGLVLLLLFQIAYSYKNLFLQNKTIGPVISSVCKVIIGCKMSPHRSPQLIKILSRNVYAHPNNKGALIISASIKNEADDQPYPLIEVSFLDSKGMIVALKRFPPITYLKNTSHYQSLDTMRSSKRIFKKNDTLAFRIKIEDPGSTAVRFQFRFL